MFNLSLIFVLVFVKLMNTSPDPLPPAPIPTSAPASFPSAPPIGSIAIPLLSTQDQRSQNHQSRRIEDTHSARHSHRHQRSRNRNHDLENDAEDGVRFGTRCSNCCQCFLESKWLMVSVLLLVLLTLSIAMYSQSVGFFFLCCFKSF